jgi:hypothetical protein
MHFVRCIDSDSLSPIVFHDINDCGQLVYAHSLTAPLDIAKMKLMANDVLVRRSATVLKCLARSPIRC